MKFPCRPCEQFTKQSKLNLIILFLGAHKYYLEQSLLSLANNLVFSVNKNPCKPKVKQVSLFFGLKLYFFKYYLSNISFKLLLTNNQFIFVLIAGFHSLRNEDTL